MRILAIVVTYYPEKELLESNVSAFVDEVDKVLIWENTLPKEKSDYRFIHHEKVEYCGDGVNSISHGLNFGWQYAKDNGYDYLLTMDQDSLLEDFVSMKHYAEKHRQEKIILGPSLNKGKDDISRNHVATKVENMITSGMLLSVEVLDVLGGYDERLAIDGLDTDLSYRAQSHDIQLYRLEDCNMIQRFGEPVVRTFCGKEYHISVYSPSRLRSIIKSHVYLIRKYKNMSRDVKRYIVRHYIVDKTKEIILFENQKMRKLFSLYYGIFEGLLVRR